MLLGTHAQIVMFWGPQFVALYNDAYAPTIGAKHPRALGRPGIENWAELWDDLHPLLNGVRETGKTFSAKDRPFYIERSGYGETVYFDVSYSAITDDDGSVGGVLCIVSETTQRVRALAALQEGESRYKALATAGSYTVYRMSPDWTELRELEGRGFLTDSSATTEWYAQYLYPEDRPLIEKAIASAMRQKTLFELEHRVRRADGTVGWTLSRALPILSDKGEVIEWFGVATDVTDRRNVEERYRHLFEIIDEGFCVIEFLDGPHGPLSDYIHIEANSAYAKNAGIPNVVGQKVREMVPDEADKWVEIYRRVLLTGEPVRFERELVATGRHLELAAFRVEPAERRQVAVLFKDTTARKRAEIELQRLNLELADRVDKAVAERAEALAQVHEMQKLETIGQLTGGVAHDFNNLLTPVMGSLDLLKRHHNDERSQRLIGGALEATERAKTLVQRLLAFAGRQTLQPRPVHPAALIEGIRELVERSLGSMIRVVVDVAANLPPALVDPNQLELALLNLSVNSRDVMPEGGTLTISAHARTVRAHDVAGLAAGQYIQFIVADTGSGMDAETLKHAVEPFFTTKGVGKGTGLGLSMVHGLAMQSGGALRLSSEVGKGTQAELWLPIAETKELTSPAAPRDIGLFAETSATLLLVDDEPLVRMNTADSLRELGYAVHEASSGMEALTLLRDGLQPHLIITDHVMPGMTGSQLVDRIRAILPSMPVLMITGYADLTPEQSRRFSLLAKPFRHNDLANRVAELLAPDHERSALA